MPQRSVWYSSGSSVPLTGVAVGSDLAALKVVVGAPPLAVVGVIGALPGQQAHGLQLSVNAGRDLDGRKLGLPAVFPAEFQMQFAVGGRLDVGEDFYVRGAAGARIGGDIEAAQQGGPVGAHGHDAAALAAGRLRTIGGFSEVEAQFVHAFLERNVVPELALARGAIEVRIERAKDVLGRALHGLAARRPGVGAPQLSGVIDETAGGAGQDSHFIAGRRTERRIRNRERGGIAGRGGWSTLCLALAGADVVKDQERCRDDNHGSGEQKPEPGARGAKRP